MNDLELQALWQEQPRGLPTAFSPAELAPRGPAVELVTLTSAFEEERLSRRVAMASLRATGALAASTLLLLGTALLHAAWLAGFALGGLAVLVWQARRAVRDDRALTALRVLRERPGGGSPALLPLAAFAAVMLALLAGFVVVQKRIARRPALALSAALSACREGATSERVSDETAAACQHVLDEGMLHPEALPVIRDVLERYDCQPRWEHVEALAAARSPLLLPGWDSLPDACRRRYSPNELDVPSLLAWSASAARACASALDGGAEVERSRACESYALVACVAVSQAQHRVASDNDLQHDPTLASFFAERARTGAAPWRCPHEPAAPAPELAFSTPAWPDALRAVLQAWMNGDEARAVQLLEAANVPPGVREDFTRDFDAVRKQYADARERLSGDAPADAETLVRATLDADARFLFRGEPSPEQLRALAKFPRSPRATLSNAMAASEYERGKRLADQKDFRGACVAWKRGLEFSHASLDLLKAVTNVCTPRARRMLDDAQTCDELKRVFDFAVDGDGFADEAQARLAEGGCR